MLDRIATYLADLETALDHIVPERREPLYDLAQFIRAERAAGRAAKLVFVCTHNSRRSHFGQIWAAVSAAYRGVEGVETFSGGTEATAFEPRAIAALERAGLSTERRGAGRNAVYDVRYEAAEPPLECFSKRYDDAPNPTEGFAAIMTCAQANETCPVVTGASHRLAITYEDPKAADDTPDESAVYDDRCRQIATEMLYVMTRVASG